MKEQLVYARVTMLEIRELELLIEGAYSDGRTRFGDLGLDLATFRTRIHSIVRKHLGMSPQEDAAIKFVQGLHGRDLYLATACTQQPPAFGSGELHDSIGKNTSLAWNMLGTTYKAFMHDVARLFFRQTFVAQDLADNVLADLFLPDSSGTSRIMSYDGRSSLCTWLRVVLYNRAVNARRRVFAQSSDVEANIPDRPALVRLDQVVGVRRYGVPLSDSIELACRGLSDEERMLLLWRYEDGLPLGEIAKLLGIHQSNVTRRLERMQGKLRNQIVSILSTKYGMSAPAIQECLRDGIENPRHAISILDFIRPPFSGKKHTTLSAPSTERHAPAPASKYQRRTLTS